MARLVAQLPDSDTKRRSIALTDALFLFTLSVLAVAYVSGIRQNLPYYTETDEPSRVARVATMIVNGDLNPHWFGHPASTVFYPLYLLTYLWNTLFLGGALWGPDPNFASIFEKDPSTFYILGRMVTISYGLLSIPLLYVLTRRLSSAKVALVTVWFSSVYVMFIAYAQVVRSDSAALFFSLLSVWCALRYNQDPSSRNRILAGMTVGLAVSSRYFMVFFILPLLMAEGWRLVLLARRGRLSLCHVLPIAIGPLAVGLGFVVSTPYFFLDLDTALRSLTHEARVEQMGADGLSRWGNFLWYLTYAIPWSVTWQQVFLALGWLLVAPRRQRPLALTATIVVPLYVACVSLLGLHFQRWLMQILPVAAFAAANCVVWIQEEAADRMSLRKGAARLLLAALVVAIAGVPMFDAALYTVRQADYGTRIRARDWVIANWPVGATAVVDQYTIQFSGKYSLSRIGKDFSLHRPGASVFDVAVLESHKAQGIDYLVVTDQVYKQIMAEPDRYAVEAASYRRLFAEHELVAEFKPTPARHGTEEWINLPAGRGTSGGGGTIRIYRISP